MEAGALPLRTVSKASSTLVESRAEVSKKSSPLFSDREEAGNNDSHNHEVRERKLFYVNPTFTFLVQTSSWFIYLIVSMWKSNRHGNLKMPKLIS